MLKNYKTASIPQHLKHAYKLYNKQLGSSIKKQKLRQGNNRR